uniref:DUF2341 domain-containing protein n=1 Tax=Tetraselmis sp. GSL018 TaxID=582737 RepID=A0A061RNF9_9CHLO
MFEFVAKDRFGNKLRDWAGIDLFLAVDGRAEALHQVVRGAVEAVFEVHVLFPAEGNYTLTVLDGIRPGCSFTAHVAPPKPHEAVTHGDKPRARFEHSMVEFENDLYVFGGVDDSGAYLSDTWKLHTGYQTFLQGFGYRRKVAIHGNTSPDGSNYHIVEVNFRSQSWMMAGKLQADCDDLLFLEEDGSRMDYWIEPRGAPNGCGSEIAKAWVEVTGTADHFYMYYGSKGFKSYSDPSLFTKRGQGFFEDFEDGGSLFENWELKPTLHDTCTPLEPDKISSSKSFSTTTDISLSGSHSLMVDLGDDRFGGVISRNAGGVSIGSEFVLKGFFFDTMCYGYHYLSPDFDGCDSFCSAKAFLPSTKNALGVYTDSKEDEYCVTYPWIKSGVGRSRRWHSFTFVGSSDRLDMYVDDIWVERTNQTDFHSIMITGGLFVDSRNSSTKAYWDAIFAAPRRSNVSRGRSLCSLTSRRNGQR